MKVARAKLGASYREVTLVKFGDDILGGNTIKLSIILQFNS